ncbi:MAG: antibiotic biosynthesis monooxygenase [Alphaproteobacteria bacterium]|nr:MAG: antibiotic biosynthesis monooxygenase [Alphaproteobacteria bacterium]
MEQYVITARFDVKPGFEAAFMTEMKQQAEDTVREEAGCLYFDVCTAADNPASIFLYEIYADEAAFEAHLKTPYFTAFFEKMQPWLEKSEIGKWHRL